jgi:hypothetical protein
VTGALLLAVATAGWTQPANDDCADAAAISSVPFSASMDNTAATNEPTDPPLRCLGNDVGEHSVWWTYTAAADVQLNIDTEGSDFFTPTVSVHRGTCGALTEHACTDDENDAQPVPVGVAAGETILIQVSGGAGDVVLNVNPPPPGTPFMLGAEFVVNTYTYFDQGAYVRRGTDVCADAAGQFVVVWESRNGQDGDFGGIFGQRFDAAGAPVGGEIAVNVHTTDDQLEPTVACEADGDFVVVWRGDGPGTDIYGVHGRRFNADGTPKGGDFAIGAGADNPPNVASDPDGNFLVVWDDYWGGGAVHGRTFDDTGTPLGADFEVSGPASTGKRYPDVSIADSGEFVVVWQSFDEDGDDWGIFARTLDASGTPLAPEFQVNVTTVAYQRNPAVGHDPAGNFVVVWVNYDDSVHGRRFDPGGTATSGEFTVNSGGSGFTYHPDVAALAEDEFFVAWSVGVDTSTDEFGQRISGDGTPIGAVARLNSFSIGGDMFQQIARTQESEFVVVWSSLGFDHYDYPDYGVAAQRFRVPAAVPGCSPLPLTGCHEPTTQFKGRLSIKNKVANAGDSITWKWAKGEATSIAGFGDPLAADGFAFCLYDATFNLQPIASAAVAPGGTCGSAPCWKATGTTGFKYANQAGNETGIQKIVLKAGLDGKAKVTVKGKGLALDPPSLPAFLPYTAQLQGPNGCWTATFEAGGVLKNEPTVFAGKASAGTPGSPSGAFVE